MTNVDALQRLVDLENRIKEPSFWGRVPCGVKFEDLQERRFDEALKLIRKHYLPNEITYQAVGFSEDSEAVDEFLANVKIWLKDRMSIAAIKEKTDKLVGVLVLRIQDRLAFSRTFSRVKIINNKAYSTLKTYYQAVEAPVDVFKTLGVRTYFKIYIMGLKERYRHRGIASELLKSAIGLAKSASVPAIAGMFTTGRSQQIAAELGYQKLNEIYYVKYLVNKEYVFYETGLGNYGCALMAYRIPDVVEPYVEDRRKKTEVTADQVDE